MDAGNTFVMLSLSASVVLQIAAATVAWGALRRAGRFRFAWICMSSALIVMVQRRLMPIAAAFVDGIRVSLDNFAKRVEHAESSSRVRVEPSAAINEKTRKARITPFE